MALVNRLSVSSSALCLCSAIDVLDWNNLFDDRTQTSDLLVVPNVQVSSKGAEPTRGGSGLNSRLTLTGGCGFESRDPRDEPAAGRHFPSSPTLLASTLNAVERCWTMCGRTAKWMRPNFPPLA